MTVISRGDHAEAPHHERLEPTGRRADGDRSIVDVALPVAANWWVRHFGIAPVERARRSIAARRPLPFKRLGGA